MSLTSLLGRTKTFPQEQPSYAQNFFDGPSIASADALRVSKRVEWILNDRDAYRRLLAQRGELAQSLLDLLQTLCDYPEVTSELRSRIYKAIIRLSKNSGLSPVCLTLNNITNLEDFPVAGGAFADIRKGLLGGQVACLKIPRLHLGQDPNKLLKNFLKEAILWRQLEHPNVLPFLGLYYLDSNKQRICLILPWMENGDLRQYLSNNHLQSTDRIVLAYDVAQGLCYLHEKEIIHGDLKGVNILVTASGRAVISDLGLSQVIGSGVLSATLTSTRGTLRWLAPECLVQPASFESDVYAFGCVCYEIFTGRFPFHDCPNDAAVYHQLVSGKCPARRSNNSESDADSGLNDGIWAIMQGCWKRDVSARPKAKVLPDQLLVAADQKFEMKPAENLFDNTFGDSLPYQLWRSIRHPELCPSGSDLEEFLFRSWSTTDIPKENDIPLSGRNESTPAATYLDDHPLVSGQFAEDVDLQNDLKEIMDKALDEKIKDIAGTLNCNGAYNPVTSISSDAHHHPITGSNNSTPMLSSAHQVFNGRLSSGFTSLRARNSYSTNTELSDSFLNGLRFLH